MPSTSVYAVNLISVISARESVSTFEPSSLNFASDKTLRIFAVFSALVSTTSPTVSESRRSSAFSSSATDI